jgi:DNA (cytosine-5)-methyltransferase 1
MKKLTHIDLFSGIGGFALAVDTVWLNVEHIFCDNNGFCQQVIKRHWPGSYIYGDIREFTASAESTRLGGIYETKTNSESTRQEVFLLTGGFPCQPFSQAGKRESKEDDRYLWPEMFRVIREFRPTWIIAENVGGLLTIEQGMVFEQVCVDLETEGYEVQPLIIPACAVNAPHRRDRIWFIAHTHKSDGYASNAESKRCDEERKYTSRPEKRSSGHNKQHVTNSNNRGQKIQEQQAAGDQQCDRETPSNTERSGQLRKKEYENNAKNSNGGRGYDSANKVSDNTITNAAGAMCHRRGKIAKGRIGDRVLSSKQSGKEARCSTSRCGDVIVGKEQVDRDPDIIELQRGGKQRHGTEQVGLYGGKDYGWDEDWVKVASALCSVDDGISDKLVRLSDGRKISYGKWRTEALMAAGNAIVPAVAIEIMKAIKAVEERR